MSELRSRTGNTVTEYLLITSVIVAILGGISHVAGQKCIRNLSGELGECESLPELIEQSFQESVEDISFLINLPF